MTPRNQHKGQGFKRAGAMDRPGRGSNAARGCSVGECGRATRLCDSACCARRKRPCTLHCFPAVPQPSHFTYSRNTHRQEMVKCRAARPRGSYATPRGRARQSGPPLCCVCIAAVHSIAAVHMITAVKPYRVTRHGECRALQSSPSERALTTD